ncbi:hypothetical protein GCM10027049_10660 [Mucilaginibacter puniceus]
MKTAERNANGVQGATAKANEATNKIQNRSNLTRNEAKDEKVNDQAPAQTPEVEATHNAEIKSDSPATVDNKLAHVNGQPEKSELKEEPKAEVKAEPKAEVKAEPVKPVLNLESTLKLVEELHRRKVQRDKLLETIQNLEAFEVNQKDEAEESGTTNYSRCELTIEDDKGKSFSTKNPVIIFHVTQYVNALCIDKLAQIEAGIIIPA